jgi:hypothetical protein
MTETDGKPVRGAHPMKFNEVTEEIQMNRRKYGLQVAILGALFLNAIALPSANAADGSLALDYCFASQLQTMKHSDTHIINLGNGSGTFRTNPPGQKFDNMSAQCMSVTALIEGQALVNGYCEWLDLEGDRLLVSFESTGGSAGKFRSISGTGKLQTMKVEGTYTIGRFPQRPGTSVNCVKLTGRWEQP